MWQTRDCTSPSQGCQAVCDRGNYSKRHRRGHWRQCRVRRHWKQRHIRSSGEGGSSRHIVKT
uniref:Uncharacterized protein n=1 Tax=Anguilla anguilla TaxID=7936 RepID=A0A0E9QL10_ANGAN